MTWMPRYTVYFVPPSDSAIYRLGSSLIGYDSYSGAVVPHPSDAGLPEDWPDLTKAPRPYGLHVTFVPPFRLAEGYGETDLIQSFSAFCDEPRSVATIVPEVRVIRDFVAIVPRRASGIVKQLATDCLTYFDLFRAPFTAADHVRRLAPSLNERERWNLHRWGYPYVLREFFFHMTLTGEIGSDRRDAVATRLSTLLADEAAAAPLRVDRVALLKQDQSGEGFRVLCEGTIRHRAGRKR